MFQHFRPRQRPVFGDVADHHDRHAARFGEARQVGCRFADLGDAAWRRLDVRHMHHLYGVDHHQFRLFFFRNQADLLDAGFGEHIQISGRQAETVRTHRHLL
ncbi:Uncharacterised protein [Salmonella enterica subsp. enterica serovar Bovismorbificans]|nr:Uncharacterised protein [Salmonella enterica subsp. enterica serovar Bovismorbificans]CNU72224.1 Uncharacterised protein [Salmonella enterica subsp. enterica serovar Bovismorbificans]CPR78530.1 Uncharacterised protein [Salmonella enterica subsp. enterica serovar Bovismorbificans]